MENVQKPMKEHQAPGTKNNPQPPSKVKQTYCILCRKMYWKHDAQDHIHSMVHHQELDTVVGNGAFHECYACKVSAMALDQYGQHIETNQHKSKLQSLKSRNIKAVSLHKTLSTETINRIMERNKQLKMTEKKATKKKKKKQKQAAAQQHAGNQQKTATIAAPTAPKLRKTEQAGINSGVVQNKENKGSDVRSTFYPPGSFPRVQSGTFPHWPGQTYHHPYFQGPFNIPPPLLRYNAKFPANNQGTNTKIESSETDGHDEGPHTSQEDATNSPDATPQPSVGYRSMQYNSAQDKDFTNDQLPQTGAIIFGSSTQSPLPTQKASEASSSKAASQAPVRDVDVSCMLRHIRKVLGIREPCRAEREARKQNVTQRTETACTSSEYSVGSTPAASSSSAQLMQTSFEETAEQALYSEENSEAAGSQVASEPPEKVCNSGKVRIAHKPGKAYLSVEARLRPTLNRLLSLSGTKSRINWNQISKDLRKKQMKGVHRFGLEMMKHPADQQSSAQPEDQDLPLSEGFQWESLPDSPLDSHLSLLSPLQGPADIDDPTEEESYSQAAEHAEQPASAQPGCSSRPETEVSVKVEPNFGDEEFGNSNASKRKHSSSIGDGESETPKTPKRKKKKKSKQVIPSVHPGQDHMDQLLTVSLREDELSYTLQDLDSSLIQARNALQAAYTEVQRIMFLKQQCVAEVNSLRTKRIAILQDMQEELSELSHIPETTAASSEAVRPPSLPSSEAIPSSSSQPASATAAAAPLHPTALALSAQHETCHLPSAQPPSHNAEADPGPSATPTDAAEQHIAESPPSANTPPPTESSAGQEEQQISEQVEDCGESVSAAGESQPEQSDVEEKMEEILGIENAIAETAPEEEESRDDKGNESDDPVEVIHSKTEIIAIEESEDEESPEANASVPAETDEPQECLSAELSSAEAQTAQQSDAERKMDVVPPEVKAADTLGESAEEEHPSVGPFPSHNGPVHGLQIHNGLLYTCSGDFTARAYCLLTKECKAVFDGHTNKINCLLVSSPPNMPTRLYTGSSDQTIRSFSIKSKKCLEQISLPDRVLCLHIAWNILYAGLASGSVFSYDLKTLKEQDVFECHGPRGVSCLGTAQEGARRLLLVGSYDSTISVRDARSGLLLRSLEGHTKTVLCMKVVNDLLFSGSSDTSVHAHNIHTGELVRIYKGHGHAVTSIVILGKVMVTASLDKLVRVYELQSHDRLQVYGGHSDMVTCMAVHKSVIYTGCYDGTVQAMKFNLMKNYRCWWQNCSLIFGMPEHLVQHLTGDHTNTGLQTVKCRWKGCDTFFETQQLIKEKLPEHMQKHVEADGSVQP